MVSWNPNLSCIRQNGETWRWHWNGKVLCWVQPSNHAHQSTKYKWGKIPSWKWIFHSQALQFMTHNLDTNFPAKPYLTSWLKKLWVHFSKPIDCTTPRVNTDVNYGLWVIMTCQHRFINSTNIPLRWEMLIKGGGYVCVEAGGIWIYIYRAYMYLPFNFAVNPKLCLRNNTLI